MPEPLWTVTQAGTPAVNGDYYPDGYYHDRQAFQKVGGGMFLYWRSDHDHYCIYQYKEPTHYYEGSSTDPARYNLPANPWIKIDGQDPPPVLSPYGEWPRPSATILLTEGQPDPTDLRNPTPTLSWTYLPSDGGPPQDAYQIHVATSQALLAAHTPDIWDSGIVESELAAAIYAGDPLASYEMHFWAVRVRDTNGIWSEDW